jgi:uncharacterized membrane protein YgcG
MKTQNLQSSLLAIAAITALVFTAGNVAAQEPTAATAQSAAASQPAPQLSYGVPQVLQLVQARVSDGIIVSFIQNSGTIYSLNAGEIVYLKQQGMSDPVLNAMLNQRSRLTGSTDPAATTASSTTASAQTYTPAPQPAVTYVETTPAYVPSSTVYVIPDTQTYQYDAWYYGGYPYYSYRPYSGYYGYYGSYPALSLSFGWGGNYGGGYHGGYNGGWHGGSGGGWHGGGGGFRGGGGGFHH